MHLLHPFEIDAIYFSHFIITLFTGEGMEVEPLKMACLMLRACEDSEQEEVLAFTG